MINLPRISYLLCFVFHLHIPLSLLSALSNLTFFFFFSPSLEACTAEFMCYVRVICHASSRRFLRGIFRHSFCQYDRLGNLALHIWSLCVFEIGSGVPWRHLYKFSISVVADETRELVVSVLSFRHRAVVYCDFGYSVTWAVCILHEQVIRTPFITEPSILFDVSCSR